MKVPETLLSGKSVALVLALSHMMRVKPCRKRLPCFRRKASETAMSMFNEVWRSMTSKQREELQYRLLQCLYWRRLGCFTSWEHFQDIWEMPYGIEEDFERWCQSHSPSDKGTMKLVLRLLLSRTVPFSTQEAKYCLQSMGGEARDSAAQLVYRLLLRGCYRVEILSTNSINGVMVQYLERQPDWKLFPAA